MKKVKDMRPDAKVPVIELAGYAIGGASGNFIMTLVAGFLLVYYTNVVGVGAAAVATVMGISKVLDGVSDLVAGYIIDHTHSKWGKCRPWMLRMILPTIVCVIMMFWVPSGLSLTAKIAYIFVTYNLVNTVCITMLSVSYAALNGSMSMDQKSRGLNGGILMVLTTVVGIVLNSTVLQITSAVGDGDPYTQAGWLVMTIIFLAIYAIMSIFGFIFTTERVTLANWQNDHGQVNEKKNKSDVKVIEALKVLFHDKYWIIFIITMICVVYMQTSLSMSNIYYAQYVLGDVFYYTPLGNFQNVGALVGVLLALFLMVKMKKRTICISGLILIAVGSFMPAVSERLTWLYAATVLKGFGTGVAACVLPGMLQDSITYGQWQSGKDILGIGNAGYSFCSKLASSLGTILLGFLLENNGFNGALAVQTVGAISAIKTLYIWVPGIAIVLSIIAMAFYNLDNKYDQISADLKERMKISDNIQKDKEMINK